MTFMTWYTVKQWWYASNHILTDCSFLLLIKKKGAIIQIRTVPGDEDKRILP